MKNYARQQFSCKDAEAVSAAVASVEKATSGEVVPVVRSYSSRYRRPVLRWILGCQMVFICSWALGTAAVGEPLTPFGLLVFTGLYLLLTVFNGTGCQRFCPLRCFGNGTPFGNIDLRFAF